MRALTYRLVRANLVLAVALLGSACEANQPVCIPKKTTECFCETGERGTQTCTDDGFAYGGCVCNPDAGVLPDAASTDASVDAQ